LPNSAPKKDPVHGTEDAPDSSRHRAIAIVDDDLAVCDSTEILLEAYDFKVKTFRSAEEFLKELPNVSLLIVDYNMPRMNGLELVSEVRRRMGGLPVIMITAIADASIERRAKQLGIRQVLKKPLGSTLIAAVKSELGGAA
jgi:two-component system response regulator DctR